MRFPLSAFPVIAGYNAYRFYATNQTSAIGHYLLVRVPQSGPAASRAPPWKRNRMDERKEEKQKEKIG